VASVVGEVSTEQDEGGDESGEVMLRRTLVRSALAGLTARERELIALKFYAGLSNAEVGRVIGVSESNAGTILHRTIDKLRKACNATV
jgi:RNA polymerase sigma-70 factor (ECF subfamily)